MKRLPCVVGILFFFIGIQIVTARVYAAEVFINEFVPAPGAVQPEWVELYNASDSAEYLKFYYLDDDTSFDSDAGSSAKKILTNINISDTHHPVFIFTSSLLNNDGDSVVLFDASGAIIDQFTYYDNPGADAAIGRYPDGSGQFSLLQAPSQSKANVPPNPTATPTHVPTATPTPTPVPAPTAIPAPTRTATNTPAPTIKSSPLPPSTPSSFVTYASGSANESATGSQVLGLQSLSENRNATSSGRPYTAAIISLTLIGLGSGLLSLALVWQKRNAILEK